jgi:microcystin degradation protein MlrC
MRRTVLVLLAMALAHGAADAQPARTRLPRVTNPISTIPTDRAPCGARSLRYGGETLEVYRGTGTCLGGMIDAAERHGVTLLPSIAATASPAGGVTADIHRHVRRLP